MNIRRNPTRVARRSPHFGRLLRPLEQLEQLCQPATLSTQLNLSTLDDKYLFATPSDRSWIDEASARLHRSPLYFRNNSPTPTAIDETNAFVKTAAIQGNSQPFGLYRVATDAVPLPYAAQSSSINRHELIIVQFGIDNFDQLIAQLRGGMLAGIDYQICLLDPNRDGVAQISQILGQFGLQFDAIHLVTHGNAGAVRIGSTWLDSSELQRQSTTIANWGSSLTADGDLLLYGCEVAMGPDGERFVRQLSQLLGADVAASTDVTGNARFGGNNAFELTTGAVTSVSLLTDQTTWSGILAATPTGPEFRVNTTTANTQQTTIQMHRAIAMAPDGSFVVVWESWASSNDLGIFAQRFNSAGIAIGGEYHVNTTVVGEQFGPAIAMDSVGNYVIAWTSRQSGDFNIYAQRFSADGAAIGGEFLVNTYQSNDQRDCSVAMDPNGDFVITWASKDQDGSGWGIYAQRFDANAVFLGSEFLVNTTTNQDQWCAQAAIDATGRFVIVWTSQDQDGDNEGIYAQQFNADGTKFQSEFRVNATTDKEQVNADVAMCASGEFVVTWSSRNQDGSDYGIYARTYNAAGTARSAEFRVNSHTDRKQQFSTVAIDSAGNFVMTWSSERQESDDDSWGIFAQRFLANGSKDGGEFQVNSTVNNDQIYSSIGMAPSGNFVIVWSGNGVGDGAGIFARQFQVAGVIVTPTTGLVTTESGGTATFSVVLASAPTGSVVLSLFNSDGTEAALSTKSLTFTTSNWNIPQIVTVTGLDDLIVDGDIVYSITISAPTTVDAIYANIKQSKVSLTNLDNDSAGILISPTTGLTTTEAGGQAQFTVALTQAPTANVTIFLSTSNAAEGKLSSSTLTFTPGNWNVPQTVTVSGVDDSIDDGDIGYQIVTSAASSIDSIYNGRNVPDVFLSNLDDDTSGITVTPTSGMFTNETGGTASFSVTLKSQPKANVVITLFSTDLSEGTISIVALTFTSANWNVAQFVTIAGVDDLAVDGDIGYSIILDASTSADAGYDGLDPADVTVINQDDDKAAIFVTPTAGLITTENGASASFAVRLSAAPLFPVWITVYSNDAGEGTVSTNLLRFDLLNWNIPQIVTVTGIDDLIADGNVYYTVVLDPAASIDPFFNGLDAPDVNIINRDNDTAGIILSPISGPTTEAGGAATFKIALQSQPTATVTIGLWSTNVGEGIISFSSVTFTPANWNVAQVVTVSGVDDWIDDGDIVYGIFAQTIASTDTVYQNLSPVGIKVTNLDDDTAGIFVTPTFIITTDVGGSAVFHVRLTSQPLVPVTLRLRSSVNNQGFLSLTSLVFSPGNWNIDQTLTVTGLDDGIINGDQTYWIICSSSSSDRAYPSNAKPIVTVLNRETATPVALADTYTSNQNEVLVVRGPGVLVNDSDGDGDRLFATLVNGPINGTLLFNPDGSFHYTPNAGFSGGDSFIYRASDGFKFSGSVVVTITVVAGPGPILPPDDPSPSEPPVPTPQSTQPVPVVAAPILPTPNNPIPIAPLTPIIESLPSDSGSSAGDVGETSSLPVAVAPKVIVPLIAAPTNAQPSIQQPAIPNVISANQIPFVSLNRNDSVFKNLDQVSKDIRTTAKVQTVTDTIVTTTAVLTAGYAFLNTKLVYWFLSALTARPAVWRRMDPIDVLYAWDEDQERQSAGDSEIESLQTIAG